jgi:hypothetical protein
MSIATDYSTSTELQEAMEALKTGWDAEQEVTKAQKRAQHENTYLRNKPSKNKKLRRALIECKRTGYDY